MTDFEARARDLFRFYGLMAVAVHGKGPLGGLGWNHLSIQDRMPLFKARMCTGLGIQCGPISHPIYETVEARAIDCDIYTATEHQAFRKEFERAVGIEAAKLIRWRWGRGPACIVFTKPGVITREKYGLSNGKAAVQLLGEGKQIVWYGRHPEGFEYTHPDGDLMDTMPPLIDPEVLVEAIRAGLNAAGIPLTALVEKLDAKPLSSCEIASLPQHVLIECRDKMRDELAAIQSSPSGTGRGTKFNMVGLKYGALIKASGRAPALIAAAQSCGDFVSFETSKDPLLAELGEIAEEVYLALPGSPGQGDQRDFSRGVGASKGLSYQVEANKARERQKLHEQVQAMNLAGFGRRSEESELWSSIKSKAEAGGASTAELAAIERLVGQAIAIRRISKSKGGAVGNVGPAIDADQLISMNISEAPARIEGLLPASGAVVFAGRPKIGKGFIVLDAARAIAIGGEFFGHNCSPCKVLCVMLEDSKARLKRRIKEIGFERLSAEERRRIKFQDAADQIPLLGPDGNGGLLALLDERLAEDPETKVIIIDTLQRIRGAGDSRENQYTADSRVLFALQGFAMMRGVAIIVIHHIKKGKVDTFGDSMNGSNGITGGSDGQWYVLGDASAKEAKFMTDMRDFEGVEIDLVKDEGSPMWRLANPALDVPGAAAHKPGSRPSTILCVMHAAACDLRPADIAKRANIDSDAVVSTNLRRLCDNGQVRQDGRGIYYLPEMPRRDRVDGAVEYIKARAGLRAVSEELVEKHDPSGKASGLLGNAATHMVMRDELIAVLRSGFAQPEKLLGVLKDRGLAQFNSEVVFLFGDGWSSPPKGPSLRFPEFAARHVAEFTEPVRAVRASELKVPWS